MTTPTSDERRDPSRGHDHDDDDVSWMRSRAAAYVVVARIYLAAFPTTSSTTAWYNSTAAMQSLVADPAWTVAHGREQVADAALDDTAAWMRLAESLLPSRIFGAIILIWEEF